MSYSTLEIIKSQNNFCDINQALIFSLILSFSVFIERSPQTIIKQIYVKGNNKMQKIKIKSI
ncbi:MAG: hypothetical protein A2017_12945 [Lentisphaerae bacterium GWF2_44_16]|nr:MAG: hypothetical protein A2017_12945 [Lentisphaerae bacterium GWF2_44_16]